MGCVSYLLLFQQPSHVIVPLPCWINLLGKAPVGIHLHIFLPCTKVFYIHDSPCAFQHLRITLGFVINVHALTY